MSLTHRLTSWCLALALCLAPAFTTADQPQPLPPPPPGTAEDFGQIEEKRVTDGGALLKIKGNPFRVDPSTTIHGRQGEPRSLDTLAAGDMIRYQFDYQSAENSGRPPRIITIQVMASGDELRKLLVH